MMKAGEYYIGDLCYVMHDEWDEVCDLLFEGRSDQGCNEGEFTLKDGRQFAIYNTNFGDGVYQTDFGDTCCVDSGSIGCILKSDIRDNQYTEDHIRQLATFQTFTKPFKTGFKFDSYQDDEGEQYEEKIIQFGGFQVYT
jgi:hypothetical protein